MSHAVQVAEETYRAIETLARQQGTTLADRAERVLAYA
jgi:hypothetical protein